MGDPTEASDASTSAGNPEPEFVTTRRFAAPRELVWQAFTEAERLAQWWGPQGFTVEVATVDLRPGGMFLYGMRAPDGEMMWGKWVYLEIVPPERLEFFVSFCDAEGNAIHHPMMPHWPLEQLSSLTFTEEHGETLLVGRAVAHNASPLEVETFAAGLDSMQQGFAGTWDRLDAYLETASRRDGETASRSGRGSANSQSLIADSR